MHKFFFAPSKNDFGIKRFSSIADLILDLWQFESTHVWNPIWIMPPSPAAIEEERNCFQLRFLRPWNSFFWQKRNSCESFRATINSKNEKKKTNVNRINYFFSDFASKCLLFSYLPLGSLGTKLTVLVLALSPSPVPSIQTYMAWTWKKNHVKLTQFPKKELKISLQNAAIHEEGDLNSHFFKKNWEGKNLKIWEYENIWHYEIWKYENMRIWHCENMTL